MVSGARTVLREAVEWVAILVIAFAAVTLFRMIVVECYNVPTGSMEPTIEVGDNLVAQKVTIELGRDVSRGDIVVFENPDATSEHSILVKRVIATAGQTVDLVDGVVYVDGVALSEPYAQGPSYPLDAQAPGTSVSFPYTVPEGAVWLMGDNRGNSADSRYFGAVPEGNLVAVALFRYWPLDRIGPL